MPPFEVGNALKSRRGRRRQFDRRVLHQRDARSRRLEAHRTADVGAAQERRLRLHGAAVCGEDECDLPRAARRRQSVPPLSQQADREPDLPASRFASRRSTAIFSRRSERTVVQTAPGEVYTALERGVVDGYGWPITGIFDLGWHEKTKYRVDPGFYTAEVSILVNKSAWDRLTDAQRDLLRKAGEQAEADAVAIFRRRKRQGHQTSGRRRDSGDQARGRRREVYHDKAYEAGWAGVIRQSPQHGPKSEGVFRQGQLT